MALVIDDDNLEAAEALIVVLRKVRAEARAQAFREAAEIAEGLKMRPNYTGQHSDWNAWCDMAAAAIRKAAEERTP